MPPLPLILRVGNSFLKVSGRYLTICLSSELLVLVEILAIFGCCCQTAGRGRNCNMVVTGVAFSSFWLGTHPLPQLFAIIGEGNPFCRVLGCALMV